MDIFNSSTAVLFAILVYIIVYIKKKYSFWVGSGFPFIKPHFPYGSLKGSMDTIHLTHLLQKYYNEMKGKGPFGGLYLLYRPAVLALDLDFVKTILIKDFNYFQDRGVYYNEKDDPLSAHLIALDGVDWKLLRAHITPTFTSGKIKIMFPAVVEISERLSDCWSKMITDSGELEIMDFLARFTTDVIGTCAFGIECNSLKDQEAEFRVMCRSIFKEPRHSMKMIFLMGAFPEVGRFLGMKTHTDDVLDFFMGIVNEAIAYRESNNIRRNDFMDLLLRLKNDSKENVKQLTTNEIAAQVFLFFAAGFETSAAAMGFSLYELALNPEIQQRARKEINQILNKYNGDFPYEAMSELTYVDCILHESLRKHSPVGLLLRKASKDYTVPNTKFVVPKNTKLWIPIHAIHHDPEHYPNPDKFDPERFTPDEVKKRHPLAYLPFGNGPRNCIGMKFGMMQARVGLVMLLRNFHFSVGSKTQVPLEISKQEFVMTPKDGLWLKITKLNNNEEAFENKN